MHGEAPFPFKGEEAGLAMKTTQKMMSWDIQDFDGNPR